MTEQTKSPAIVEMTTEELKNVRGGAFDLGMTGAETQNSTLIWAEFDRDVRDQDERSTNR